MSNFFFSHKIVKNCLLLMCQNEYLWIKGLIIQEFTKSQRKGQKMFLRMNGEYSGPDYLFLLMKTSVAKGEITHYQPTKF